MTFYLTAFTAALVGLFGYGLGLAWVVLGVLNLFTAKDTEGRELFGLSVFGLGLIVFTTLVVVGLAYLGGFQ